MIFALRSSTAFFAAAMPEPDGMPCTSITMAFAPAVAAPATRPVSNWTSVAIACQRWSVPSTAAAGSTLAIRAIEIACSRPS